MADNKAVIRNGKIIYGVEADQVQANPSVARERRQEMKTSRRKDLLQKNQVDFYRAYPDQAKNLNPDLRRLLS